MNLHAESAASEARFYQWCDDQGICRGEAEVKLERANNAIRDGLIPDDQPHDPWVLARRWLAAERWPASAGFAGEHFDAVTENPRPEI